MFRVHLSSQGKPKQAGIATAETAIVITVLIVLLLVSAELGRLFYHYNEFTKSVRNVTRYVSNNALHSSDGTMDITDAIIANAKSLLIYGDIAGDVADPGNRYTLFDDIAIDDITITEDNPYIIVEAEWEYITLFGSTLPNFGISTDTSYTLKAASTMRALE